MTFLKFISKYDDLIRDIKLGKVNPEDIVDILEHYRKDIIELERKYYETKDVNLKSFDELYDKLRGNSEVDKIKSKLDSGEYSQLDAELYINLIDPDDPLKD